MDKLKPTQNDTKPALGPLTQKNKKYQRGNSKNYMSHPPTDDLISQQGSNRAKFTAL